MNIVVTVPKSEIKNIADEDQHIADNPGAWMQYWSLKHIPQKLKEGERVYFIENGYIKYYHIYLGWVRDFTCEVTNRFWPGINLQLQYPEVPLQNPIPMRGFQNFRYLEETYE